MRVPIAYGLSWPERIQSGAETLDFLQLGALTFEAPDAARYPGLQLAWQALRSQEGHTCVLNAANEVAVEAFLQRRICFDQIHRVNEETLTQCKVPAGAAESVAGLLALDAEARRVAAGVVAACRPD